MPDDWTPSEPHEFVGQGDVWFLRKADGCLEIHQTSQAEEGTDVIHIHGAVERDFIAELTAYSVGVHGRPGLDPEAARRTDA